MWPFFLSILTTTEAKNRRVQNADLKPIFIEYIYAYIRMYAQILKLIYLLFFSDGVCPHLICLIQVILERALVAENEGLDDREPAHA